MGSGFVGVPGYLAEVTDAGDVRSTPRVVIRSNGRPQTVAGKLLTPAWNGGHWQVPVFTVDGVKHPSYVHRLMLLAFVGQPPTPEHKALHWDDDPNHNLLPNLYWGTMQDNAFDRVRNGRDPNARKDECNRGHLLEGPNLAPWSRRGRVCLACNRAATLANYRGIEDEHYRQLLADEKYALIMGGDAI